MSFDQGLDQRAIVGEWRDGTQLYFSPDYANPWWRRMRHLQRGMTLDDALDSLNRLTLDLYPVEDELLIPRLPRPDQEQTRILEALGVHLPGKFANRTRVPRR